MAYSVKKWAKARSLYETGNYTVDDLWKKCGMSARAFEEKIKKEGWIKGKLKPEIEEKIEKGTVELFVEAGMAKKDIVEKLVSGTKIGDVAIKEMTDRLRDLLESGETPKVKELIMFMKGYLSDMQIELKYCQEINKMAGWLAPTKTAQTTKAGDDVSPVVVVDHYDYTLLTVKEMRNLRSLLGKCLISKPSNKKS